MVRAASEYPDVKFVFIDGNPLNDANGNPLANVVGVAFHEEQCGYLAGYAAVTEGYTKLGFTGGGGGTNPMATALSRAPRLPLLRTTPQLR